MSDQARLNTILRSLAPYRIDEKNIVLTDTILGRGGFGVVQLGEMGPSLLAPEGGTLVAVKQLYATGTVTENNELILALAEELHVWAGLAHDNIVPLIGFFLDEHKAWLVSPYMKNGNIRSYLHNHSPGMVVRLRMWGETARGITYLHRRGLCHGDIKGANTLVGDEGQAKICDFGLTKLMEEGTTGGTSTGPRGTTRYMPPEFFLDEPAIRNRKSDVWAWSCLGLEVLFDRIPYAHVKIDVAVVIRLARGEHPLDVDSVILDDDIRQLFKRCWVSDPHARADMKSCTSAVTRVLERIQMAIGSDEPLLAIGAAEARTPLIIHADGSSTQGVPSRSSSKAIGGSGSGPKFAPRRLSSPNQNDGLSRDIDRYRQELSDYTDGHPKRPKCLSALATCLSNRFYQQGDATDMDEAIDLFHQALSLQSHESPERHSNLIKLALMLKRKYDKQGNIIDLDEAIDKFRQALLLIPPEHPERHNNLIHLALVLKRNYDKRGRITDLDETIDLFQQALLLLPQGHPERHNDLIRLALVLKGKYDKQSNITDLDDAIDFGRQTLLLRPVGRPRRLESLNILGTCFSSRYQTQRNATDLDEAISLFRQALQLQPHGHPGRHNNLIHLALLLRRKYDNQGNVMDLDEAINLGHQTLLLRPVGHPERLVALHSLAITLAKRYDERGHGTDLDKAIDLFREALLLRPQGHPRRHNTLIHLASVLERKYDKQSNIVDLDEAIDLGHQTLLLRPMGHPERLVALQNLAVALGKKYDKRGNAADVDQAISLFRQALLLQLQGHPERHVNLIHLAVVRKRKYEIQGDVEDLDEAIALYKDALMLLTVDGLTHTNIVAALDHLQAVRSALRWEERFRMK